MVRVGPAESKNVGSRRLKKEGFLGLEAKPFSLRLHSIFVWSNFNNMLLHGGWVVRIHIHIYPCNSLSLCLYIQYIYTTLSTQGRRERYREMGSVMNIIPIISWKRLVLLPALQTSSVNVGGALHTYILMYTYKIFLSVFKYCSFFHSILFFYFLYFCGYVTLQIFFF